MQKHTVAGCIEGFLICQPKTRKIKSVKILTSLGSYCRKCKNGDSLELLLLAKDLRYCFTVIFQKNT